ncbi:MAG TPA: hypothetical protein VFU05_13440 [Cyclobacteriaceae bacterium]|nr:hypothetical protein [Cyclobacteriaceae bacterium]
MLVFFGSAQTGGLRGGLNFSRSITGIHLGGFVNLGHSEKFSNQFEASFSQFGTKQTDDPDLPEKLNYFKIASAFKFYPRKDVNVHIGPEFGIPLNSTDESNDFFRLFDFGLIVGLEGYFTKEVGVGLRYYAGLHNFGDDDSKNFNSAIQLSFIYLFKSKQLETWGH